MKWFECFALDAANECLLREGAPIALPPKPFAVLRYLVDNPGRLITHDELLDALWPETYVQPQVLRTYVLELRKALGDDAKQPRFIQTLPKRGFRFVAAVEEGDGDGKLRATPEPAAGLVGREAELARLSEHIDRLKSGQRQIVFITGETGIGKTALVDAFCRQMATRSGITIARGQCVEGLGHREEYYPVKEALSHLCAPAGSERARAVLSKAIGAWLPEAGREAHTANGSGPAPLEATMASELCAALEELARETCLIVVLEDVHWADGSTLDLVSALARRRAPARLMVLATCRLKAAADATLTTVRSSLAVQRLCDELPLEPLGRADVKKLLSRVLLQDELPAGLTEFVLQRSEGNPLFVFALLEHLQAQQFLVRTESDGAPRWEQRAPFAEIDAEVPHQLAQMIELEIARLAAKQQRLLEAASLMPVAFPAWAVAAALEENEAETEEACDELARRLYFLHRVGEDELPDGSRSTFYSFAHELFRDVLYRRQSTARRAHGHTRVAERLSELFAEREDLVAREMALHLEAAGQWDRAARTLSAAARYARARAAGGEAAELFDRALRLAGRLSEPARNATVDAIHAEMAQHA